jgi:predicted transcriptional regulator
MEIPSSPSIEAAVAAHRQEIQLKIEEGHAAAQLGEFLTIEEVRSKLRERART